MNYIFRPATADDSNAILEIYAPFIEKTCITFETEVPTKEAFRERVVGIISKYPYFVCEHGGKIVGYAYASGFAKRNAYRFTAETSIYILAEYHRTGIGRKLYTMVLDDLSRRGFCCVCAVVALPNEASLGLHKALGFREAGTLHSVGFKQGKWLDVMYLEKTL